MDYADKNGQGLLDPFLAPLVRSIAGIIGRQLPARSGTFERVQPTIDGQEGATDWSPYTGLRAAPAPHDRGGTDLLDHNAGVGADYGMPARPSIGTAFMMPSSLWNLAGVASGWSAIGSANPSRQPTAKLAFGHWSPFPTGNAPLPTLPEPARMVGPIL